ncbi:unnamed protein product, partial [Pleuronectes platessa]
SLFAKATVVGHLNALNVADHELPTRTIGLDQALFFDSSPPLRSKAVGSSPASEWASASGLRIQYGRSLTAFRRLCSDVAWAMACIVARIVGGHSVVHLFHSAHAMDLRWRWTAAVPRTFLWPHPASPWGRIRPYSKIDIGDKSSVNAPGRYFRIREQDTPMAEQLVQSEPYINIDYPALHVVFRVLLTSLQVHPSEGDRRRF